MPNLQIIDASDGSTRDATTQDFSGNLPINPIGSVAAITVTTASQTLAALLTAAGAAAIDANCNWLALQLRDDQTAGQVVRINYTGTASATSYDATMSLDAARVDPVALHGKGDKAAFDAYRLLASANAIVLVRQFVEG